MARRRARLVRGHALVNEGDPFDDAGRYVLQAGPGHAKCECGAMSPPLSSNVKRRQWHREHKAAVSR